MILLAEGVKIFLIVLGAVILIAGVAFGIYISIRPKLKINDKPSDEEIVNEEMNRVLKPIEDDETAKAVSEYKEEDE